jgi:hypothetical protein
VSEQDTELAPLAEDEGQAPDVPQADDGARHRHADLAE